MKVGDCVLFDVRMHQVSSLMGCMWDASERGYCSDMTRTFYFKEVSDEHRHIYETVRKANEAAIAKIKTGHFLFL